MTRDLNWQWLARMAVDIVVRAMTKQNPPIGLQPLDDLGGVGFHQALPCPCAYIGARSRSRQDGEPDESGHHSNPQGRRRLHARSRSGLCARLAHWQIGGGISRRNCPAREARCRPRRQLAIAERHPDNKSLRPSGFTCPAVPRIGLGNHALGKTFGIVTPVPLAIETKPATHGTGLIIVTFGELTFGRRHP